MNLNIFKALDYETKSWGGGATTELYIYPEYASYSELNFDFRLSTATVEVETSNFTALPGISRQLMVLDGEITLYHEKHHTKTLQVLDVDCFEGEWKTGSKGFCTDINLMTTPKVKGKLSGLSLKLYERNTIRLNSELAFFAMYLYKGALTASIHNLNYNLSQGELVILSEFKDTNIELFANGNCILALVEIEKI